MRKIIRKFIKFIKDFKKNSNLYKEFFIYFYIKLLNQNHRYTLEDYLNGEKIHTPADKEKIDRAYLKRIMEAFIKAKHDQKEQSEKSSTGGEWELIIDRIYGPLSQSIYDDDIDYTAKILSNFGREKISTGLSLLGTINTAFLLKLKTVNKFNKTHPLWKAMTGLPDEVLKYPRNIGNIFGLSVDDNNVVTYSSYRSSYMAQRIVKLLENPNEERKKTVLEIGGGFGPLPYHLFRSFNFNCTYIDIEIPENCLIISYFLKECFPDKKILLYGEKPLAEININDYDIVILPAYSIQQLPDLCCDLVYNAHSLTEMSPEIVKEYISQINRISRKYFLHANHEDENLVGISKKGTVIKHVNLNKKEFELPENTFKRVYRFPELISDSLFSKIDNLLYWEYLYERL